MICASAAAAAQGFEVSRRTAAGHLWILLLWCLNCMSRVNNVKTFSGLIGLKKKKRSRVGCEQRNGALHDKAALPTLAFSTELVWVVFDIARDCW